MAMASSSPLALQPVRYVSPWLGALYRLRTKPASAVAAASSSSYHGEAGHGTDIAAATEVPREVGVAEQLRVTRGREKGSPPSGRPKISADDASSQHHVDDEIVMAKARRRVPQGPPITRGDPPARRRVPPGP
jgi:hypothetical protein